jgi:hypothetical protein
LALACSPLAVYADNYNYGSNTYSSDVYNGSQNAAGGSGASSGGSSGPASSSPGKDATVVTTPSGLEVAINLADGQAIPSTGYYITITPLNGQGKTFDKAEIYLDGKLVYTGTPDGTGTLKWLWDTANNPATKVKIIVFGPGDGQTVHEFNVTVSPVQGSTNNAGNQQNPDALPKTDTAWSGWVIVAIGAVIVAIGFVIWIVARRRRHDDQFQPPTFPSSQPPL